MAKSNKAVADPSQFPNLKIFKSMPKPARTNKNIRMISMTSDLKTSIPPVSFLNDPDRPYPIITPISVSIKLNPLILVLLSMGSV